MNFITTKFKASVLFLFITAGLTKQAAAQNTYIKGYIN